MSNVNPQSNNLKYIPPKDADKDKEETTKKPVAPLEEDDEFEDFPVEGIPPFPNAKVSIWMVLICRLDGSRVAVTVYEACRWRNCTTVVVGGMGG